MDSFAYYISALRKDFLDYCTKRLSEFDVTYGQLFVLIYISKRDRCTPKEITENMGLDAGYLNRMLGKFIEKKFILYEKSEIDKRVNIISLTEDGKKIVEVSRQCFIEWDQKVLAKLEEDKKQDLLKLMKQIVLQLDVNGGRKYE